MHKKFALLLYLIEHPGWHSRDELMQRLNIPEGSVSTYIMELEQGRLAERGSSSKRTVCRALARLPTPAELKAQGKAESSP